MRQRTTKPQHWLLTAFFLAFTAYILLPLLVLGLMSLKDSSFLGFPITAYSTRWYRTILGSGDVMTSLLYSIQVSLISATVALTIGTWSGLALARKGYIGRSLLFGLIAMPIIIPGIVSAISFRLFIQLFELNTGTIPIVMGTAVHSVPFVTFMVMSRAQSMPSTQIEAAKDLGADDFLAFWCVTVPYLKPALIGGGMFAVLIAFEDFTRAFFLGGFQQVLPVLFYTKLSSTSSPEIAAIAMLVVVITGLAGFTAEFIGRRSGVR